MMNIQQSLVHLQSDGRLIEQLCQQLEHLIEYSPYQQSHIDLAFLELVACIQEQNHRRSALMKATNYPLTTQICQKQGKFLRALHAIVLQWQEQQEINRLRIEYKKLMPTAKTEHQHLEQAFVTYIEQYIHEHDAN